jgi:prolyl oligopeptidase
LPKIFITNLNRTHFHFLQTLGTIFLMIFLKPFHGFDLALSSLDPLQKNTGDFSMRFRIFAFATMFGAIHFMMNLGQAGPLDYPKTKTVDLVEDYHGTKVADPYRWLEDDVRKSDDVKAWVDAQVKISQEYLSSIPQREKIKSRLTELWNYERVTPPTKIGGRIFFRKNDGLQNQAVLYVQENAKSEPRVLLDPNLLAKDGTVALASTSISDDGEFVAYSLSEAGSDWQNWKVRSISTLKDLGDDLRWTKFTNVAWTKDGKGFFYSRYEEPMKDAAFQQLNLNQRVMYHRLGTAQSQDVLVYQRPDHPEWGFNSKVTEDGRYLVLTTWKGTDHRYRITVRDLFEPFAMPVDLIDSFESDYSLIDSDGPVLYFKTDRNAPNGRVIAIDLRKPEPANWVEIIPQSEQKLDLVNVVGNQFICSYLKDARTQVKLFTTEGKFVREVEFPGIGTASGFDGRRADLETFYVFSSYALPPTIFKLDLLTGKSETYREAKVKFDANLYETKQIFYASKDGTKVPMFITAKKGIKLDGTKPTLLYGYGGFNISLTPAFSPSVVTWLEMGGIYCVANLRGGGEYGQNWHKAGTKLQKQNVFDDFISAAEFLIKEKYTSSSKLAIQGGSNGGLLVGACLTQRPELYGAALPAVGVMDMLRFQKFTAGRFWVDDYGSSDNAEEFKALYSYSPYHNIKSGVHYPPTMVITADTDDRVVPGHSFKFAAKLQASQAGDAPILARIETKAGHGAGKPTAKIIEEQSDIWAFLVKSLGVK